MAVDPRANDSLHHGEVFQVIVSLEQGIASEELDQDAANAPYIARKRPAEAENDFRCSIMASANNRGMIFILEGSGSKVDQPDLGIEKHAPLRCLPVDCGGR